ncbi:MAG: TetR/AcrR family transcriptional regulator [Verrucomicrobiaceae bacterium]|nr:TetR/AcrR family transcriptional regulator [Verrucomicrobiaceae bacterium]
MTTTTGSPRKEYSDGAWQLMVAAEKLFGHRGIENVSLREIATAAGHANNSAVQYHFGSKENLVQAVFEMRLPALDAARTKRLEIERAAGPLTLRALLAALLLPVLEEFDDQSLENFVLFMTRLAHRRTAEHPFFLAADIAPASVEIVDEITRLLSHLPFEVFSIRLRLGIDLFLDSLAERNRIQQSEQNPYLDESAFWNDILDLATAVMQTPLTAPLKS